MSNDEFFLQSLMGKEIRATLSDHRIVTGSLHCVDYQCNLIIYEAKIFQAFKNTNNNIQTLSSCMIPGEHLVKLEVVVVSIT